MTAQNEIIDYCGMINLLRQLLRSGACSEGEANKIAARIAAQSGVNIRVSL